MVKKEGQKKFEHIMRVIKKHFRLSREFDNEADVENRLYQFLTGYLIGKFNIKNPVKSQVKFASNRTIDLEIKIKKDKIGIEIKLLRAQRLGPTRSQIDDYKDKKRGGYDRLGVIFVGFKGGHVSEKGYEAYEKLLHEKFKNLKVVKVDGVKGKYDKIDKGRIKDKGKEIKPREE